MSWWAISRFNKTKQVKSLIAPLVVFIVCAVVYTSARPSYLPKGEIKRSSVPTFEHKDVEVRDLLSKPMSGEERDKRRNEMYKEKLPFIEDKELTEEKE